MSQDRPITADPETSSSPAIRSGIEHLRAECNWLWRMLTEGLVSIESSAGKDGVSEVRWPTSEAVLADRQRLDREVIRAVEAGSELPLVNLAYRLRLKPWEVQALVLLAACGLYSEFRDLCRRFPAPYSARGLPTVRLLHVFFCDDRTDLIDFVRLIDESPLVRGSLIRLIGSTGDGSALRLQPGVLRFLLAEPQLDPSARSYLSILSEDTDPADASWLDLGRRLRESAPVFGSGLLITLSGPDPVPKRRAMMSIGKGLGRPVLRLDLDAASELDVDEVAANVRREAALRQACLLIEWWRSGRAESPSAHGFQQGLMRRLREVSGLIFIAAAELPDVPEWQKAILTFTMPATDIRQRRELWRRALGDSAEQGPLILELSGKFRLEEGQIIRALGLARDRTTLRDGTVPTAIELIAACREVSRPQLANLATPVAPAFSWDDLILPEDSLAQLRELVYRVNFSAGVLGEWGFDRKLPNRRGTSALFVGPSGAGKTMAAQIVAGALGLDLYRIDLSSVVSKYVGETEKKLATIFEQAESSNAILFFDEADALFGKRSEVRDAQDRFANIEISYLLQRMEEYDGVAVLASNRRGDIDEAFTRRLDFAIPFPEPGPEERRKIWAGIFPPEAPLADDLDLEFMAQRFRITGGNIRNIALAAAFLARASSSQIAMEHLIRAAQREYQKAGRLCSEDEFGPYYGLLQERGH